MLSLNVRDLVNYSVDQIWSLPDEDLEIHFEDGGALVSSARATIFSWYAWAFFRIDPTLKIGSDYHFGNSIISKGKQLNFLGKCQGALASHLRSKGELTIEIMEELWRLTYYLQNLIYNDFTTRLEEYVTTLSALDILEIVDHKEIAEINANTTPVEESLTKNRLKIVEILAKRHDELPTNRMARQIRIGGVDAKQAVQMVAPIGFRTEISSDIFPIPVMSSFSGGLKSLYELAVESRSASKALMFTKAPLADTQYFNRSMQLLACSVMRLHHGEDCGTTVTVPFHVTKASLRILAGKFHRLEDGTLEVIGERSDHLVGTVVQLRSPLTCNHRDQSGVCGTCFGELQWSIAVGTNLGHACVVEICEKISQLVLSVKHIDSSSSAEEVVIDAASDALIERGLKPNEIKLRSHLRTKHPRLHFARNGAHGLAMLGRTDWSTLSIWDISAMDEVCVVIDNRLGEQFHPVTVSMGSRLGSFTIEFLQYIAEKGIKALPGGEKYEVDISDWDFQKEVWRLPLRHRNMIEYKNEVEEFVKCGGKNSKKGQHKAFLERLGVPVTPVLMGDVLRQFNELISSKLFINIAHLEVTLLATMARSTNQDSPDYRLPRNGDEAYFASYNDLIANRSLAPAMAWESQKTHFISSNSFNQANRPESPLDPIMRAEWTLDRSIV